MAKSRLPKAAETEARVPKIAATIPVSMIKPRLTTNPKAKLPFQAKPPAKKSPLAPSASLGLIQNTQPTLLRSTENASQNIKMRQPQRKPQPIPT